MNLRLGLLGLAGLLACGPAQAASCALLATPQLDFGAYSASAGVDDAQGALQISCVPDLLSLTVSYTITLSPGSASTFYPRRLTAGAFGLNYNLYTDPARTTIWGDGTNGSAVVGGTCAALCSTQVYGRIPAGQSVPAAQYRDDVLVTLEF